MKERECSDVASDERRRNRRIPLDLKSSFPVRVETTLGPMRGTARNVSEGGMLIEARQLPPIGSRVRVVFELFERQRAPGMELEGDVRHHLMFSLPPGASPEGLVAFGVRFLSDDETQVPEGVTLH